MILQWKWREINGIMQEIDGTEMFETIVNEGKMFIDETVVESEMIWSK